ncbi:uncharacterized protein Bfra_006795 [Botrytis fragariae]|uniref:Uncharacterized protein n=1 Tax=Botrytis fragariae TaxID=1964551 RepID=A0A8H6EPB9_9HELO|nr:uncharacterized protein Bfra_006795 [Botrytis fragariae]KAF5879588.1 hypothetical protein Bfra_006795 [Botrytis fragariae]
MSTAPSVPPLDATALTVREYISHILHNHYDVPKHEAESLATQWKYGRGSELRTFDVDVFRSIFGVEAGTLLFAYLRNELGPLKAGSNKKLAGGGAAQRAERDIFGLTPGLSIVYLTLTFSVVFGFTLWYEMGTASSAKIEALIDKEDFVEAKKGDGSSSQLLAGDFNYGANRRKTIWGGPKPVLGHGIHSYLFQVVGLSEELDATEKVGRKELGGLLEDKVLGRVGGDLWEEVGMRSDRNSGHDFMITGDRWIIIEREDLFGSDHLIV